MNRPDIKMVDLLGQFREIETEVMDELRKVIDTTAFINGPAVSEFALELQEYLGVNHVIPCGNGTDALQIALMALDLEEGSKVAVPAFTYIATVEVIALLKLTPVFVDVDPRTFSMDPEYLEQVLANNRISAIMPVHLYGQSADINGILSKISDKAIPVIEDNAQAIGSTYRFPDGTQKKTGTIGTIGTTSFFPSKNLGAFGDGGALSVNEPELAKKIRMIANHGQSRKYYHDLVGVNSRLDTLQAAILKVKLKHLDEYAQRRSEAASYYDSALADIDGLVLPFRASYSTHVFHQYTVKVKNGMRDALQKYLLTNGVPSVVYYPVAQHLQKAYQNYGYHKGQFPVSEDLCNEVLSLPIHTQMSDNELDYICTTVKSFFGG